MNEYKELSRDYFDSTYGSCEGFLHTEPRTINDTGTDARIDGVRQYTVQTFRAPERGGDFQFVTIVEADKVTRVCLPPVVTALMGTQKDNLATRAKRAHGRMAARNLPRPAKGIMPPQFVNARKGKRRRRRKGTK